MSAGRIVAGQRVVFQMRPGVVLEAREPREVMGGRMAQGLTVKDYAGTHLIGSCHSELSLDAEELRRADEREARVSARIAARKGVAS